MRHRLKPSGVLFLKLRTEEELALYTLTSTLVEADIGQETTQVAFLKHLMQSYVKHRDPLSSLSSKPML
jgi:hypothetical protein